ncbi:uncharacterized protein BHQ10_004445 [Talaromyces amestolkiae]|uniref:Major facilitator superfamily (MFS) profile domain-containing protein n=1 Tax=Talaromyces amestolkiae TaxID=1196081 RepID=A0A364KXZ7_TALAM|nr:uncharacterized protein BHQ10_004445 [Talaromyces amestolkiae]RAO68433.1 hypothetical protein BHQ10_004445 [Talaromyces amestolkiae]
MGSSPLVTDNVNAIDTTLNDDDNKKQRRILLWKLDLFILSWACFGYFVRILDSSNISNAYVSGLKEDLNVQGNEYNLFSTLWTCGYIIGQIPSQLIITKIRPSIWIPCAEVLWAIFSFSFAAVKNVQQVYALRFLIGLAESPFYVGAMTMLGNWYTPKELGKRATIFYSASFAANMFSGYLQAAVYKGLDGTHGLAGWRWLFIMCGVISVPGAFYGFFAVPDSPYSTKARWLSREQVELAKSRMIKANRKPFQGVTFSVLKQLVTDVPAYFVVIGYIFFCLDTLPLGYFAIWLKALKRYSTEEVNVIPTGAYAIGFVSTIFWGWLSDQLGSRLGVTAVISVVAFLSCLLLTVATSESVVYAGYFLNAAGWGYGAIILSWINETYGDRPELRAFLIGTCQTLGATFSAWVPVVIFNVGKYAPSFHKGYIVVTVLAAVQFLLVFVIKWFTLNGGTSEENETSAEENEIDAQTHKATELV